MRRLGILAAAAMLAACAGGPPPAPQASPEAAVVEEQAVTPPPPQEPPRAPLPETVKGLSAEELVALIGPADRERRDPPAFIWQYRTPRCTLDVFVYDQDGSRLVRHTALRNAPGLDEAGCLAEVARSRR